MEENFIDIVQKYIEKDPSNMEKIKAMMDYRALRTEQAVLSTYANEYKYKQWNSKFKEVRNAREFDRSWWEYRIQVLDEKRRDVHNDALISMIRLLEFGDKSNLPPLYGGRRLDIKDVIHYNNAKYDIRKEMTDGMFDVLFKIQEASLRPEHQQISATTIQKDLVKECDTYNIKVPLRKDESDKNHGGIEFRFNQLFNNNISENL